MGFDVRPTNATIKAVSYDLSIKTVGKCTENIAVGKETYERFYSFLMDIYVLI